MMRRLDLVAVAAVTIAGLALAIALRCRDRAPPERPAEDCPELAAYSPEVANRPIGELEHALLTVMSPAMVRDELAAIRKALQLRTMSSGRRPPQLRAVVETSYLDDRRIRLAARIARAAGVDMVVTSTGLGPRSASPLDVELLQEELGSAVPIKTAGGVRTADEVAELLAAGARRVGVASAAGVLDPVGRR